MLLIFFSIFSLHQWDITTGLNWVWVGNHWAKVSCKYGLLLKCFLLEAGNSFILNSWAIDGAFPEEFPSWVVSRVCDESLIQVNTIHPSIHSIVEYPTCSRHSSKWSEFKMNRIWFLPSSLHGSSGKQTCSKELEQWYQERNKGFQRAQWKVQRESSWFF